MSGYQVQLNANILLGPGPGETTDYSLDISQLTINKRRNTVTSTGTYGNPDPEDHLTGALYTVAVAFAENRGDPTGVWQELWAASEEDNGEVYFEGTESDGPVSPTNPKFTGYIKVNDLDAGIAVNTLKGQTKTWPARGIVGPSYSES